MPDRQSDLELRLDGRHVLLVCPVVLWLFRRIASLQFARSLQVAAEQRDVSK
jgi:hypothetical protein